MKLRLTVTSGTLAGQSFDLETGFLTIGRSEMCSVRFDPFGERIASKQHAFIEAEPDGYYITDNQSTNGTFVNGESVQRIKLASGDHIRFGRNGSTATVNIANAAPIGVQDFRDSQYQNFQDAARKEPNGFQHSFANLGLGHLESVPHPSSATRYIGVGIAILLLIPLAMIVIGIMFLSLGVIPAIIASVIAFVPAALYILPLMALDRYDP
ncbi:MAG: FHA domain-containing protein, partial [Acidobacteria bacterium]|nr:FHA domain-containing protein [Acidobacteriota bacterium]